VSEFNRTESRERYLKGLFPDSKVFQLFRLSGGLTTKLSEDSIGKDVVKRGDFLLVTLKRRSGEYSEAVAKLT
jgi:hypothetical protein